MKRFLVKCLLLALIVGGILHLGGLAYQRTTAYENLERNDNTQGFSRMPEQIDLGGAGTFSRDGGFSGLSGGADRV